MLFYLPLALLKLFLYTESSDSNLTARNYWWYQKRVQIGKINGIFWGYLYSKAAAPFAMIFEAAGTSSGQSSPAAQQPLGSYLGMNWLEPPFPRAAQFACGCNSTREFDHSLIKSACYQQHTCFPLCKGGNKEPSAVRLVLMLALSNLPGIGHTFCALIKPCFVSAPKKLQCTAEHSSVCSGTFWTRGSMDKFLAGQ